MEAMAMHGVEENTSAVAVLRSPAVKDFVAGAIAGMVGISVSQPLDTVRVRLQQPSCQGKNTLSLLSGMVRREGVLAPWKGLSYPLAFASLQSAVVFQAYGQTVRWLIGSEGSGSRSGDTSSAATVISSGNAVGDRAAASPTTSAYSKQELSPHHSNHPNLDATVAGHDMRVTPWQGFLAGSVAGLAQVALWSPVELLKLRVQLQTFPSTSPHYVKPLAMARHVLRQEGLAGLYRGVTVTTLRDVPSYGVYFGAYHWLVQRLEPGVHHEQASALTQIVAGGTAGCLAWTIIYPLDVVKSRMQAETRSKDPLGRGATWLHYTARCWRDGGARSLLAGIAPTLSRAFLMDSACFLGYIYALRALHEI